MCKLNLRILLCSATAMLIAACGSSSNTPLTPPPPPPPPTTIDIGGQVYDGAVSGGTLFGFSAADVNAAIDSASDAADRAAALAAANPLVTITRDPADGASYTFTVTEALVDSALFLVFDGAGATDAAFVNVAFGMEAVVVLGALGSTETLNVTPHTTVTAIQVRMQLDPDGDGTVIDATEISTALAAASANTLSAYSVSELGDNLFPGGEDPSTTTDTDVLDAASTSLGLDVRTSAALGGISPDEAIFLFAADAADGMLDGVAPMVFGLDAEGEADLAAIANAQSLGDAQVGDMEMASCSASAASLRRACEFEVLDEFFIGNGICAHSATDMEAEACRDDVNDGRDEALAECGDITDARLDLCVALNDAIHEPPFGQAFAANFVDPLDIGNTVPPNTWFPMTQGTEWVYEGTFEEDGEFITETITITVTDRIKLVDGIRCLVVRDVVVIDGELIEDTDDWFAQDVDGNVWYCGEEAKDYEIFEDDTPAIPELVAIDGSFKAGRDGDEAGILLPGVPTVGDVFRQEMSVANAEDVIEILATDGTESVPAAACAGDCLVTRDFSPLDPGAEENKYYAPGVGKILEIDLESGDRFELISITVAP